MTATDKRAPSPDALGVNAATLNAMVDGMGAIVMCLARELSVEQRDNVRRNLARLAANAEAQGNTLSETLLITLRDAVR